MQNALARGLLLVLGIIVVLLSAAQPARAQNYYELLRRVPDSANVLVLVNVDEFLRSPIALREGWPRKQEAQFLAGLSFPPDSKRMLQASKVDWTTGLRTVWDVCLVDVDHEIAIPTVARAEGGYVDKLSGMDVAWSPRNAFVVRLAPQIAAMMFPANRQDLAHWLGGLAARKEPVVSKYLQNAVVEAHGKPQIVVACDMAELLSRPQVRARLRASTALAGKPLDLDKVAAILTGLKGVTFSVEAGQNLEGRLRVDFRDITDPLKEIARPMILEVLEAQGVLLPELRDWRIQVYGTAIRFEGRMTPGAMRTISSFVAIPSRTLPVGQAPESRSAAAEVASAPAPASRTASSSLQVTRRYFQEVSGLVDDLRSKSKNNQGYNFRVWFDRYALQIDRMPILGVDPEVLEYGTYVSDTLRGMRNVKIETKMNQQYARAANYSNDYYTDNALNATLIKRQAEAGQTLNLTQVWTDLETRSAQVRKAMTQKYRVEF